MKVEWLDNGYINFVKKAIRSLEKQHEAISENIANVSNPEYVRKRTDFLRFLEMQGGKSKLVITRRKHIPGLEDEGDVLMGSDKEKVDINREMSELAENQVRHDFVTRVLRSIYDSLNKSITGKVK
ncbi:MAG: hypothetical protein DRP92_05665 [Candidatus Neomarinimicrobiota bacterium]|nr:hypothetical protein [Candidatus Neomarinimicrobiota bacterium]RKY48251.1 MAG: hypothetical protein DRP88_02635 [Candidatus Neomarinimicrobiota bacterium]RKY52371.1 MAG: hypothetical protein DRP92_05665 [Candidatus Neomarinimicrobiota bacterium]